MERQRSQEYNSKLKNKINHDFIHRVLPNNILPVIKRYDAEVLTERDMEVVRARTSSAGKIAGAEELLELMSRYDNWFSCLMQALRVRNVKLESLARQFEQQKAELDQQEASVQMVFQERPPQDDFDLDNDGSAASGQNGMVPSNDFQQDGPSDEQGYEIINFRDRDESQPSAAERPPSHVYEVPRMPSPSGASGAAGCGVTNEIVRRPTQVRQQGRVHGPEYDFSFQETEGEFAVLPGWNPTVTESEIKDILQEFLNENGRYVLWYWTELKRPAISVTYNGDVKNFIVHKRPRKSIPGVMKYYFINRNQHCGQSMTSLMQFHFTQMIQNTEPGNSDQFIPLRQQFNQ